jgi:uncharacterized protein YndB with AHSA1/START domain
MPVRREIEIEASPEEVWEALATQEGRARWLDGDEPEIVLEQHEAPARIVWWWAGEERPATRVEFLVVAAPAGTRVIVTESAPQLPLAMLAASFTMVAA